MKQCPRCRQTYSDDQLNFCLNDGELLNVADARTLEPESPPTLVSDPARTTNPIGWEAGHPIQPFGTQNHATPGTSYGSPTFTYLPGSDKTLPTISLILGIAAVVLVCCAGGIWLGLPAAMVGYLGMRNADGDPGRYSGRGLAIAGMVLGIVTFLISLFLVVLGQFGRVT